MNKIRTFVVDDEPPARRRLLELLAREGDIEIAGAFAEGAEALEAIEREAPDLLFLDVRMPGLDGFALLEAIKPERQPITIFVTAYDAYALKAFEVRALDYLLKPFSDERFEAALARGRERVRSRRLLSLVEGKLETESSGLLVLLRHIARPKRGERATVLAKQTFTSATPARVPFHLGYSDEVTVFLNGEPLFTADDSYSFDRPRREGLIGLDQATVYLPLREGENELVLAVTDLFGGWGLMGQAVRALR